MKTKQNDFGEPRITIVCKNLINSKIPEYFTVIKLERTHGTIIYHTTLIKFGIK